MKRIAVVVLSMAVVVALVFGATVALAAKPQNSGSGKDVIALSNGFPSGEHFNLNIHGKKADFIGDPTPGGNSVFILEYSLIDPDTDLPIPEHIQYVSNKKASLTELTVLDPLAEAFSGDPAKVQLPYEPDGYYVFGRILGKPNNGQNGQEAPASSIILYPNAVVGAWNDTNSDPDFGDYNGEEDESLLPLGLIVGPNAYVVDPVTETYVRFDPGTTTKGKGKSKATDITRLFTYTGWVVDASLDTYLPAVGETPAGDGVIDINDVPLGDYDSNALTPDDHDYDNDGDEDADDVEAWLTDMSLLDPPMAWYFENEWILNIADLVITEQGLVNDGTKLLQVRFYPVDTTDFIP
jgi:hypothetical protein